MGQFSKDDVLKLADLARVAISDDEAQRLSGEIDAILGYVSELSSVAVHTGTEGVKASGEINVMREDVVTNEAGVYTETLLSGAPRRSGQYVRVKKIL